jgi:hypothetical protein
MAVQASAVRHLFFAPRKTGTDKCNGLATLAGALPAICQNQMRSIQGHGNHGYSMIVRRYTYFFHIAALIVPIALSPGVTSAQAPAGIPAESQLTLSQVVEKLVQKNAERATDLETYRGKRIYQLDYRGFSNRLRAEIIVEMTYNAPDKKEFTILSESGNKWIVKEN